MIFNSDKQVVLDRLIGQVLSLHYMENKNQAEVAKLLGLSTTKVNRIIRQAREDGLVEVKLNISNIDLYAMELELAQTSRLKESILCPTVSEDPQVVVKFVAETAANLLLDKLRDGDTICISGGKAILALVESIRPTRGYDITVVPATGGVQGKHYTDVNHLAFRLAEKLGGKSMQLHAPLFADSKEDRDLLLNIRSCKEVIDCARNADIALLGLGSVSVGDESYFDLRSLSSEEKSQMALHGCVGEVFAHLLDAEGMPCYAELNEKLVGLTLPELQRIPVSIGLASGDEKVALITSVCKGGIIKTLVSDEKTAKSVLKKLEKTNEI
jgi:DNA-binding transcriptional regulator LsrR (DeoR family)